MNLTSPSYQALQDDRYIVTFDPSDNEKAKKTFHFAYTARAVTAGHYQLPASTVVAMYQPQYNARILPGTVDIH